MDWTILGIQPVKDKKAITAAYRARLVQVNPEDKPEEFKALRAAYEEALRLADQTEEVPARDESPVGLWLERLRAIYNDFPSRIRPESWKELLADEVCLALDKRPLAEEALLHFLMEDYFIPQWTWQLLDDTFAFSARREELYESYSRDFIDNAVLNGIHLRPNLPYELFIPGRNAKDCDDYRRLYHRANQTVPAEMGPILEQMATLSESHPYGQLLVHRLELEQGKEDQAKDGYRRLAEAYPQDTVITMGWAALCMRDENWAEGETLTRRVLEIDPSHKQAKRYLADCLANQDNYAEAKDLIYDLMNASGGDQMQLHQLGEVLRQWNELLIQRGEEQFRLHPEDSENASELAWSYLQNNRPEDALRLAKALPEDHPDAYGYHNLLAKIHYARRDFAPALEHFQKLEAILRTMQPDGTDKTEKRIRRLPEFLQIEGSCMMALDQKTEARAKYEEALALAPEDPEVLTHMGRLLYSEGELERAAELLTQLTIILPGAYHGHLLLAMVLYDLGRDRGAFDAVNRALSLEGSDLGVYTLKMRILIRNGLWDAVHEILDFLAQHNITDEITVAWCKAQLTEFEEKNSEKALEQYQALAARIEAGESLAWASQIYYRITVLTGAQRDARKEEDRNELLAILEKGLAQDENDADCLDYKAWLLKRAGEREKALALYHRLEALPYHGLSVERNLAELYYEDLSHDADKALYYYQYVLDRDEHADLHFYIGTCRRYLGDYAAAEQNYLREQELAPDDVDGYNGLTYVYEALGRNAEALEQINKALDLVRDRDRDYTWLYNRKVQVLRRMARPQEALDTVTQAMERYDYDGHKMRYDICCQFGLWDEAAKMLKAWKKAKKQSKAVTGAEVRLEIYRGRYQKVRPVFGAGEKKLNKGDLTDLRLQMAELDGDWDIVIEIWRERLETLQDKTHALMNLSEALWWAGEREEAKALAEQALVLLDEKLQENLMNAALYRSRKAMVLALAGRPEEAREELAATRRMPLCAGCDYGSCKDADIFEAVMEEIAGNHAKALALHQAGMARWPDELDFTSGAIRARKEVT